MAAGTLQLDDLTQNAATVDRLWTELSQTRADTTFREIIEVFQNEADQKFGVSLEGATSVLKHQLLKALTVDVDQRESSLNFLLKLISKDLKGKYHIKLAFQFMRAMVKTRDWDRYLSTTLGINRVTNDNECGRGNSLLHEAAKTGHCKLLEQLLGEQHVNMRNARGETPLHLAAEYGHSHDVKILLNKGASLKQDKEGCTPLHSAALSVEPNKDVARLLINANPPKSLLNAKHHKTEDTALHCAARNRNVTAGFIEELRSLDPLMRNKVRDTAFHVAAKSDNTETFMAMMSTFAPTKCGWDVDDADYDSDLLLLQNEALCVAKTPQEFLFKVGLTVHPKRRSDNLLDICARRGNADAVASLIHNGADIGKGIFHIIIEESVRKEDKIDELKAVYRTIAENVVLWHYLEMNEKCPMKHSDTYKECLRMELTRLTTEPPKGHISKMGAIDYAISLGAGDMLMEILNTRDVYRFDKFGKPHHYLRNKQRAFSRYDVTNFISATMAKSAAKENRKPYLSQLVDHCELWRPTDILSQQPFKMLIGPFIGSIQLLYSLLAIVQLAYMIWFTGLSMLPNGYKNVYRFSGDCDVQSNNEVEELNNQSDYLTPTHEVPDDVHKFANEITSHNSTFIEGFVLTDIVQIGWPLLLLIATFVHFVWFGVMLLSKRRKNINSSSEETGKLLTTILLAMVEKVEIFAFCMAVFFDYVFFFVDTCDIYYLLMRSMAHLFGWLTTFAFFSGVTKEFHVFSLLLRDVLVKDILFRFILVFVFTIIAFSFSIHILRQTVANSTDVLQETVFHTFLSSFGLGDSILNDANSGSVYLKIVFAVYICVMMVILLNVLIAMVNTRYEDARQRAENEWRFGIISAAIRLHDRWLFRRFTRMEESVICCRHSCLHKYSRIYPEHGSHIKETHDTIQYNSTIEHYDDRYFIDVKRVDRNR